jgi:hypothetical protein
MKKHKKSRCEWRQPDYNHHHRLPRSRGGTDASRNVSIVRTDLHDAYNLLFGSNPTAQEVVDILSAHWIDPDYRLVAIRVNPETNL